MKEPARYPPRPERFASEQLEQRISIEDDGHVIARSGKVEYGQGIRTGFARIVADELFIPLDRVEVVLGETDNVPWDMGTVGSMSTATDGRQLRAAAVQARTLLLDRASKRLDIPPSMLSVTQGTVVAPDGQALSYEDLVRNQPLTGPIPEAETTTNQAIEPPGDRPERIEARAILTGAAKYPADVRLPRMARGHVVHPPRLGMQLAAVDDSAVRAISGVIAVVHEESFVGIVAERDDALFAALHALKVEWRSQPTPVIPSYHAALRQDEGIEAALSNGSRRLKATFHAPHIAHASILPRSALADVRSDCANLYVATQRPFGLRRETADLLELPLESVHIHPQMMSGMYGRGNAEDVAIDAVRLSRAARRPVLVQWSRAEEFHLGPHRPVFDAEMEAAVDTHGTINGWRYNARTNSYIQGEGAATPGAQETTAGRDAEPPYRLGHADIQIHVYPSEVPTISFRSLGAAPNVFAIESFIDELACASRRDSIDFRLALTDDDRLRRVLESVRAMSEWKQPREKWHGLGVACAIYHGTYIAEVAEVSVTPGGPVRLERMWCAVDAGRLVHPDGARNQIEGGVQQAASWTLLEELKIDDGIVTTSSWRDYPIATFRDAPRSIDVCFVGDPDTASTGVGEPGSVPTAAAIANAVFSACGKRIRRLPIASAFSQPEHQNNQAMPDEPATAN